MSPRGSAIALALALALALAGAGPVSAQVYRWTTDLGEVHYSQGIESVPERYRGKAQLLGYTGSPAPTPTVRPATPEGVAKIQFTPGRPIYVEARINGGGTAQLLVDTGAAVTVINPWVLQALGVSTRGARPGSLRGVTGTTPVLVVQVDSVEVGPAKAGPLHVVSHDAELGQGDGLLGRDFLDRFTVTIDNAAGILTLSPK